MNIYITDTEIKFKDKDTFFDKIKTLPEGCSILNCEYIDTNTCESDDLWKDLSCGRDKDSPFRFLVFNINKKLESNHNFLQDSDFILSLYKRISESIFMYNDFYNIEKSKEDLLIGTLYSVYIYRGEYKVRDSICYYQENEENDLLLIGLPRKTVLEDSTWNKIVDFNENVFNNIFIERLKKVINV